MRRLLTTALLVTCLVASPIGVPLGGPAPVAAQTTTPPAATTTERWIAGEIHRYLNDERQARGLAPLPWAQDLSDRAAAWSAEMAGSGSFRHSPEGFRTLDGWYAAAENIYAGSGGYASSSSSNRAFMHSDGHRRNMLNPSHDAMGVGVVCRDGKLWVTHLFAQDASQPWQPAPGGTPPVQPVIHGDDAEGTNCNAPRDDAPAAPSPAWPGSTSVAPAPAPSPSPYERLAGSNRFATAAEGIDPGARRLVIASGGDWPDAVAAAALGGSGTAVLLVERDRVPAETVAAAQALDVDLILVMGGTAAVSRGVVDRMREIHPSADVRRLAGATRTQTAVEAARQAGAPATVVVADAGEVFDALIGASSGLGPLLLADSSSGLPAEALDFLRQAGTTRAMLIGRAGQNPRVSEQLAGMEVVDLGRGRADGLSAQVARSVRPGSAGVLLASGASWPDTLTAAALAVRDQHPLLLGMPDGSTNWQAFDEFSPETVRVVGGAAALPDSALPQ